MKRRSLIILLLLVLIVLVVIFLLVKKEDSFKSKAKDFGIEDISQVTSVKIKNDTASVVLERNASQWQINYHYKANERAVKRLLSVLQQIEVYAPVPQAGYEQRIDKIISSGKQVIIKNGGDLVSSFYLYEDTSLHPPTVMMKSKTQKPYIVKIPGIEASLSPVFSLNAGYWKANSIIEVPVTEIEKIKVIVPETKGLSFIIEKQEDKYIITSNQANLHIENPDPKKLTGYLMNIGNISFVREVTSRKKFLLDSLNNATPYYTIEVTSENGNEQIIELFRIPIDITIDETGAKAYYDYHYLYVLFDGGHRLAKAKWVVFDPVLKEFKYFLTSKNT